MRLLGELEEANEAESADLAAVLEQIDFILDTANEHENDVLLAEDGGSVCRPTFFSLILSFWERVHGMPVCVCVCCCVRMDVSSFVHSCEPFLGAAFASVCSVSAHRSLRDALARGLFSKP